MRAVVIMSRLLLVALLILAGCAATPEELYDIAIECNRTITESGACNDAWDIYHAAELERMEEEKRACPTGRVYDCTHWSCQGWEPERCVE